MLSEYSFDQAISGRLFNALREHVVRSRTTITAVFLGIYDETIFNTGEILDIEKKLMDFLETKIRKTDFIFKLSNQSQWFIILSQSGEKEATAFLQRLYSDIKNHGIPLLENKEISFSSSVAEIGNNDGAFEELLKDGNGFLNHSLAKGPWQIEYITAYKKRPMEKVRVSILEENEIFRNVLHTTLENLSIEDFEIDIRDFQDGYEFLQSDWYISSHTHIIIMNDILPRQNGLEVLHKIRMLPNSKRFIVYMMTKRNSEEDMIYAYESGVDNYLIKPFNLRLFEVQVKRTFKRLWT
ncbi:response regulator [Tissierella sp.]|uniref:response regulator transcription factor n=1 Tax=Tissierella sp. TaxID=41274 RepID=UPI002857D229|nr:response regulator [Tissierella sp.]MDR7855223.1 response regulator [Tissierella sp.]